MSGRKYSVPNPSAIELRNEKTRRNSLYTAWMETRDPQWYFPPRLLPVPRVGYRPRARPRPVRVPPTPSAESPRPA
eukprot:1502963-Prymnesium_polylepis.1